MSSREWFDISTLFHASFYDCTRCFPFIFIFPSFFSKCRAQFQQSQGIPFMTADNCTEDEYFNSRELRYNIRVIHQINKIIYSNFYLKNFVTYTFFFVIYFGLLFSFSLFVFLFSSSLSIMKLLSPYAITSYLCIRPSSTCVSYKILKEKETQRVHCLNRLKGLLRDVISFYLDLFVLVFLLSVTSFFNSVFFEKFCINQITDPLFFAGDSESELSKESAITQKYMFDKSTKGKLEIILAKFHRNGSFIDLVEADDGFQVCPQENEGNAAFIFGKRFFLIFISTTKAALSQPDNYLQLSEIYFMMLMLSSWMKKENLNWGRRGGKHSLLDASTVLQLFLFECSMLGDVFFVVLTFMSCWITFAYKAQTFVFYNILNEDQEWVLMGYLVATVLLKFIALLHCNIQLILQDTFFIDWERPKITHVAHFNFFSLLDNLCGFRGLESSSELQTFSCCLPISFRKRYDEIMDVMRSNDMPNTRIIGLDQTTARVNLSFEYLFITQTQKDCCRF
uniref:Meckelin n=1 Tax=Heterorhabditis bacteriophora TaxID=37862 RepID=A0A1I7WSF8_HETBA